MAIEPLSGSAPGQGNSERRSEPYTYTPLGKRQIRVLELSPAGQETDQLRGKLLVKSLDELPPRRKPFSSDVAESIDPTKHVCFEAISYVWGPANFTESLVTPGGSIRITPSLASILRRLRHAEEPRLYWADGVCINQNDVSEKEIQVPLMGVIYGSAVRVLCDICEESEDVNLILDAMQRYWKKNIRRGWNLSPGMTLSKETTAAIMGVCLPTQEEVDEIEDVEEEGLVEGFLRFISSPWFHRLWIFQEFVLGRDVSMIFGRRHLPWGELYASTECYFGAVPPWAAAEFVKPENKTKLISLNFICSIRAFRVTDHSTAHGQEFLKAAGVLMGCVELSQAQFPLYLTAGCFKHCSIPRDRYFAILGLMDEASDGEAHNLQVDYASPIRDVTMRFWKHALKLSYGGSIILMAGLAGRSGEYPSWLRDITVPDPLGCVWQFGPLSNPWYRTGGDLGTWSVTFSNDDPDQMIVQGRFFDTIAKVSSMERGELFDDEAKVTWFSEAITFFTSKHETAGSSIDEKYLLTGETIRDAAIKTLCYFSQRDKWDGTFTSIQQLGQSILSIVASSPDKGEVMMKAIKDVIEDKMDVYTELFTQVYSTSGLRLCKTNKGMFALFRKEVSAGDSVWVVKGCRLPAILRPSLAHVGSFEVVGFGYVHGIMNGEVMQMPGFQWKEICLR